MNGADLATSLRTSKPHSWGVAFIATSVHGGADPAATAKRFIKIGCIPKKAGFWQKPAFFRRNPRFIEQMRSIFPILWYAISMNRDVLTYPPLRHPEPFAPIQDHGDYPLAQKLREVYDATGYPATPQGRATRMAALRGSTAVFYTDNRFRFRHPKSDIDIVALTDVVDRPGARYLFYTTDRLPPIPREVDILCFTPRRLEAEFQNPFRIFLITKMIQPGLPIVGRHEYEQCKAEAMATIIVRGAARRRRPLITPSGAARLIIEEDLFAEPWRWLSMRTYYREAPTAARQRFLLTWFAHRALDGLLAAGAARDVTAGQSAPTEPVYELDFSSVRYGPLLADRSRIMAGFVYDQFNILFHSGGASFAPDQAIRFMMKAVSLSRNPRLRFDADLVFG